MRVEGRYKVEVESKAENLKESCGRKVLGGEVRVDGGGEWTVE